MSRYSASYDLTQLAEQQVRNGNLPLAVLLLLLANNRLLQAMGSSDVEAGERHTLRQMHLRNQMRINHLAEVVVAEAAGDEPDGGMEDFNPLLTPPPYDTPVRVPGKDGSEYELPQEIQRVAIEQYTRELARVANRGYLEDVRAMKNEVLLLGQAVEEELAAVDPATAARLRSVVAVHTDRALERETAILALHPARTHALQTGFANIVAQFRVLLSTMGKYEKKWNSLVKSARRRRDEGAV